MASVREGGCKCGAVRYRVTGEPLRVGMCHCKDCRRETGSVFNAYAAWPRDRFEATGPTRSWKEHHFCPACGSPLFSLYEAEAEVEVKLGTLDDAPTGLTPQNELWIKRRESWLPPVPGARQHVENRTAS